ncbi:YopX family protein [Cytobacillus praedii]|uniref:YopX family protein n=1 Tax=Cytobacillus praedii TaxID=1742358 RepID=UPI002E213C06|nr:YopX family protein [Cytobacillus praedii]
MREIKFRAWEETRKLMFMPGVQDLMIDFEGDVFSVDVDGFEKIDDLKIMQYTGLKDKNGKEIYEGDILKVEGSKRRYVVQWNEEELAFTVYYRYANDDPAEWILSEFRVVLKTFEVIGNIYENPELIK